MRPFMTASGAPQALTTLPLRTLALARLLGSSSNRGTGLGAMGHVLRSPAAGSTIFGRPSSMSAIVRGVRRTFREPGGGGSGSGRTGRQRPPGYDSQVASRVSERRREREAAPRPTFKILRGKKDVTADPVPEAKSRRARFFDPEDSFGKKSLVYRLKTGELEAEVQALAKKDDMERGDDQESNGWNDDRRRWPERGGGRSENERGRFDRGNERRDRSGGFGSERREGRPRRFDRFERHEGPQRFGRSERREGRPQRFDTERRESQSQRFNRSEGREDRPERFDRSDRDRSGYVRPERDDGFEDTTEKLELDRSEDDRPSRQDRFERSERPRSDRPDRPDRDRRFERSERSERSERPDRPRFDRQDRQDDTPTLLSIPYTTAASQFLYGRSVVEAALRSDRRQLYRLYVHRAAAEYGRHSRGRQQDDGIERLAVARGLSIQHVDARGQRLMDKMSKGRPHNGYVLEASPLRQPPVVALGRWREHGFDVELGHQSREDAAVNGTDTFVQIARPGSNTTAGRHPLVLLLDQVLDPGNLGAILRTASFLGVSAVAVSQRSSAGLTSVALKASAGAAEAMALLSVEDAASFVTRSRDAGWRVYAAVIPGSRTADLEDVETDDPLGRQACLLVVGSEGEGLPRTVRRAADVEVAIANRSGSDVVDSLNVSVAAGLLCAAFLRGGNASKVKSVSEDNIVDHTGDALDQLASTVSDPPVKHGDLGIW
ncbi:RNA methyltransferase [Grosmannia clavigera kw1407]|uniref:rRNA methyltransferase 1, mitochondrial n=1 Tax=Grosmannia clavigera (strain kw1407 / UAMH 11150) TaxID=655863 RepID=F0XIL5_GROCL|nr:RNA methyltransferase [Grosmannia clavigera kw1407]EFX02500.1 RNA methyltransferase [Grosmannia clavigera kw1407]